MELRALRDQLEELLLRVVPRQPSQWPGAKSLAEYFEYQFSIFGRESILVLLDQQGICASTGSACTAGSSEPSHVLRAMKVPADWLQGAVRFSLSRFNTRQEVLYVNEKMPAIVQRLEGLSALGKLRSCAAAESAERPRPVSCRSKG